MISDGKYVDSPIANTTMKEKLRNGNDYMYEICPIEGYLLHDKAGDIIEVNPDTGEETTRKAFYRGGCTCLTSYDFEENPREFYTVLEEGETV